MTNIRDMIKQLAQTDTAACIKIGKVVAVDEYARTVDVEPLDDDAPMQDVRLQGNVKSAFGVVSMPKIGSWVVVGLMDNVCGVVLMTDEIDWHEVTVGDMCLRVTEDCIVMNGGELGGMVRVEDLVSRLNAIENDINALKAAIGGWTPISMDGGSALKGAVSSWCSSQLTNTNRHDIENERVKQ